MAKKYFTHIAYIVSMFKFYKLCNLQVCDNLIVLGVLWGDGIDLNIIFY